MGHGSSQITTAEAGQLKIVILYHDGKGAKDRITMLPESLKASLRDHLTRVRVVHQRDLADGCPQSAGRDVNPFTERV
ncbi:MAG: hypothetical protein NBKEAIPA_02357 [Nitrospirae bacterium]|nr:hypothetical protein [Nitrospirota bacterium]MCK6494369.1 hypothetical protein [Nitrospira sp.]MEB2340222.1 hypothetical protein [Nitrospirales bacterium]